MKNLFLAIALVCGLSVFAQNSTEKRAEMSAEQRTELRVKELTLKLDLSASQQKEMSKLLLEQQQKREAYKTQRQANKDKELKMTSDEKFAMKSKMLDEKIAFKTKLKSFLNPAQIEKWEKMSENKGQKMQMKRQKGQKQMHSEKRK